jgi:carboxymethylenebutenolidase
MVNSLRSAYGSATGLAAMSVDHGSSHPGADAAAAAALFAAHMQAELNADLAATMATMVADPHLLSMGSGCGGEGVQAVAEFYATHLIGQFFPPDVEFISVSRTVDAERLVDELVIRFTHTEVIGHLLPGVTPTGRSVEIAIVVIVGLADGKVAYEHIYWDQASLLAQLGLLNPSGLPIVTDSASRLLRYTGKG